MVMAFSSAAGTSMSQSSALVLDEADDHRAALFFEELRGVVADITEALYNDPLPLQPR